ncbi:BnaA01g35730D [Brassica napus]|uniref:BnaA01g35730D protein n=1 Tax=Brassica napus TaxID=3708 RepID=A0A078IVR3_BRANA|nr:BnaA01g35730D [Brassica napus]
MLTNNKAKLHFQELIFLNIS